MRLGEDLAVHVSNNAIGTPELELAIGGELDAVERLERRDVELLRDACEAFLSGTPLPR